MTMAEPLAYRHSQRYIESPAPSTQHDLSCLLNRLQARDSSLHSLTVCLCDPDTSRDVAVDWNAIAAALCADGPSPIQEILLDLSNASTEVSRTWQTAMLPALASLKESLQNLTLKHCSITPTLCGSLLATLDPTRLKALVLSNNPLGPRGAKVLASFLRQASALQVLNVSGSSLGHFGAQALGGCLPSTLVVLDVSRNNMGHDGIWKFADAGLTKELGSLVELNVSSNLIGDDGCLEIANRLAWLPMLELLNLSHSDIGNVGIEGLAHSLMDLEAASSSRSQSNRGDLADCYDSFDSYDGLSLPTAPAAPKRILELSLSNNRLDNDAARHLGAALTKLGGLQRLDLSHNSIGDDGAQSLVDGLLVIPDRDLECLDLSHNQIGDLGAGAFVEHLESLLKLRTLVLTNNPVSEARTRIVDMLLKHRQTAASRSSIRDQSATRRDERLASEAVIDSDMEDGSSRDGSTDPSDGDFDEEQLEVARDRLAELLMHHHEDEHSGEGTTKGLDRTQLLLLHQRHPVPVAYLKHLTNNFDKHRILNTGAFGTLYAARDEHPDEDDGGDDHHHPLTLTLRELEVGPAGPLQAVRDAVLAELVGECQNLRTAGFLPAVAVTVSPSAMYVLYDTAHMLSLRQILSDPARRQCLALLDRVSILSQVARALQCLHTGEVSPGRRALTPSFHGDVQPSNIYVSIDENDANAADIPRVRLTDALLSRLVATDRRRFKFGDAVFGSRSYRCPRYERGSAHYDPSCDMFSFGVVMAEVLSGKLQRSPMGGVEGGAASNGGGGSSKGGVQFYDVYYDVILSQRPFAFDPVRDEDEAATARDGGSGGTSISRLRRRPTARYQQMLVQVMASCMGSSVGQRPTASTVARILENESPTD